MSDFIAFAKRNCLTYFRDKASVMFSLMGVLIVILLYLIFLRSMLVDSILSSMGDYSFYAEKTDVQRMVDSWVLAGVLAIVSVTTSAGALQTMVQDKVEGKMSDFKMTSLSPVKTSAAYVLSTFIVGQIMSIITFVIVVIYLAITGCPLSFSGCILTLLLTIPASLSGSIIIYALTCRIKSPGAFSGFFTVLSVLIGFLTGIYMPMGTMEGFMQTIGSMMPASHIAALMRQTLGIDAFDHLMNGAPAEEISRLRFEMGYDLELFGYQFTPLTSLIYVIVVTLLFFGIAVFLNRRRSM